MRRVLWIAVASIVLAMEWSAPVSGQSRADLVGAARILEDASLRVRNVHVWLYGIYVPEMGQHCIFYLNPPRCGSRAAVALETKIQGFVYCDIVARNEDGSVSAFCSVGRTFRSEGDDLGAYLVARGLAVASPGAPFEYVALERIAQSQERGFWGFQVDTFIRRR